MGTVSTYEKDHEKTIPLKTVKLGVMWNNNNYSWIQTL